jgi:hypothetical protein
MWYYKLLPDLLQPPAELIEKIDMVYRPQLDCFKPDNTAHLAIDKAEDWKDQEYNWIKPMASNTNVRYRFDQEYTNWVKQNIIDTFEENNSGVMFFDHEQLPHTDTTREYVLLYNIETGGPNATLSFWQEDSHPVVRTRGLAIDRGPSLKLLDQINGPHNCWYIMHTQVIHSVENVSARRTNFQVSFNILPDKFR